MLSKDYRLTKTDVERVYKKGRSFREDFIVVRFAGNKTDHFRVAIVIPKKVAPKATQRTRLKRKTIALLQNIENKMGTVDIILSYKQFPDEKNIQPVLEKIFRRIS